MADLTQKVVGYRFWVEHEGALNSQGHTSWTWGRGVQEARCDKSSDQFWHFSLSLSGGSQSEPAAKCEVSPGNGCTCGLHAYHDAPEEGTRGPFQNPGSNIPGVVLAWGTIEVHKNGFRSQFAEILCLGYNELWPRSVIEKVKKLAMDYEVDCLPLGQLKVFAEEHGSPVPKDLYPEEPPSSAEGAPEERALATPAYPSFQFNIPQFTGGVSASYASMPELLPLPALSKKRRWWQR